MSHEFQAIYEKGVLRPLVPIVLREREIVSVSITARADALEPASSEQQREALLGFIAQMESLPESPTDDGLTNRDHDQILYGGPK